MVVPIMYACQCHVRYCGHGVGSGFHMQPFVQHFRNNVSCSNNNVEQPSVVLGPFCVLVYTAPRGINGFSPAGGDKPTTATKYGTPN